jgi:hypothetical protein
MTTKKKTSGYTIKSLLFEIIPEAAEAARGRYPSFSQRDLYYVCRDRYLNHPERPFDKEYRIKRAAGETDIQYEARREAVRRSRLPIDYKYFTTKVLREYEREYGEIDGLIRETYGTFVEPHTGESIELGTREVADYRFPDYKFDKILLVEKLTERPKFEHDRIAEKYDMAIIYSRGYATEALHHLLTQAQEGNYQVFVWHDADVDGYNIVRNLREATDNMPTTIEVIDIGLSVEEALRIGCASEPFTDDDALPRALRATLDGLELEYFEGRQVRFEINGIPSDSRIAYVEEQLREHGIRSKYIPPNDVLEEALEDDFASEIEYRVGRIIDHFVDKDAIVTTVMGDLRDEILLEDAAEFIRGRFEVEPTTTWSDVVDSEHRRRAIEQSGTIEEMVREAIVTNGDGAGGRRTRRSRRVSVSGCTQRPSASWPRPSRWIPAS